MKDYYSILSIPKGSKIEEIKKAYRKKAKEFHPDRNKSADAQEKFIEITEAYEVLVNGKPSKKAAVAYQSAYDKYKNVYSAPSDPVQYQEWLKAVRERAWRESGMSYEEYKKKSEARFKKQKRANTYASLAAIGIIAILAILVFTGQWIPFLLIIGISLACGMVYWIYSFISDIIKLMSIKIRPGEARALKKAGRQFLFAIGLILVYWSIWFVGNRTLISVFFLMACFLSVTLLSLFLSKKWLNEDYELSGAFYWAANIFCIGPASLATLLWINFLINYNNSIERYKILDFKEDRDEVRYHESRATHEVEIILDHDAYHEFRALRTFDSGMIVGPDSIVMNLGRGIFGLRVLRSYEFIEARPVN